MLDERRYDRLSHVSRTNPSTALVVTAATEDEAKAIAAQRALDGELTWQIEDNNVWQDDSEEIQIDWIEEA